MQQRDVPGKLALGLDSHHNSLETVILKRLKHEEYIHFRPQAAAVKTKTAKLS